MACAVEEGEPVEQQVFIRGDYNSPGEDAPKAFPLILAGYSSREIDKGSGRLELADWLTQPEHPLTARVMVNRIWQWHFGEGLVRTPDNFGKMGERPTHPELLDYLAQRVRRERLVDQGDAPHDHAVERLSDGSSTSPKAARKPILRTACCRASRAGGFDVEEIRDGLLAIDGSLDSDHGRHAAERLRDRRREQQRAAEHRTRRS